jgi:hypothetical protein
MCFLFLGMVFLMAMVPVALIATYFGLRRARTNKTRAAVAALGWTLVPRADYKSIPYANSFQIFAQAHQRRIANLISGMRGNDQVMIFDYSAEMSWFTNRPVVETIALVISNQAALPTFRMWEQRLSSILGLSPRHPISFTGHPVFTSTYGLDGEDEGALRRMFDNDMLAYLESNIGLNLEGSGGVLVVHRRGVMIPPEGIARAVDEALFLFHTFAAALRSSAPPSLPPPLPS